MDAAATYTTTKSERTRALIRDVALNSFRERGYDATTIRLIAQDAGISVGTTNYHFASKNDLVQELYLDVQLAHRDAVTPLLATTDDLVDRLALVFRTGLDELEPYHRFAPEFLSAAMSPRSSVNPLSEESTASRDIVVGRVPRSRHRREEVSARRVRRRPAVGADGRAPAARALLGLRLLARPAAHSSAAGRGPAPPEALAAAPARPGAPRAAARTARPRRHVRA